MAIESAEGDEDIVLGEYRPPRRSRVVKTVGEAAAEYFEWCEKREAQRKERLQQLAESGEPAPAASRKAAPPFDKNARTAVAQFVSLVTPGLPVTQLTPRGIAVFQETIGANAADVAARLLPVKEFLRFCWKNCGYTDANLGNYLRVKSETADASPKTIVGYEDAEPVEMTAAALERLEAEWRGLQREQYEVEWDSRDRQAPATDGVQRELMQAREHAILTLIAGAQVVDPVETGRACLGCTVRVRNLDNDAEREFSLVGPSDAGLGGVSVESPVGRGLVAATIGAVVEVEVPRGTMRFEIVSIEA